MNVLFETLNNGSKSGTNEWLTPPFILENLGEFDLDPCSPIIRPWNTAKKHYNINDNGLLKDWNGRVFCNPPYGNETSFWLKKCSEHKNAIALTFARTETKMFFEYVWKKADAVFFIKRRLQFYTVEGVKKVSAGAPSVLIAYGQNNVEILKQTKIEGKFLLIK